MGRNQLELTMIAMAINQVIALCYQQGTTTSLRDIFQLLRMSPDFYANEWGLDDPITITNDQELLAKRDEILARFGGVRH